MKSPSEDKVAIKVLENLKARSTKRQPDEGTGPPDLCMECGDTRASVHFDQVSEASIPGRILWYNGED